MTTSQLFPAFATDDLGGNVVYTLYEQIQCFNDLLRINGTLTVKVISWPSVAHTWLSHTSTNTNFFPKPPTASLKYLSRGERRKYARKKVRLNLVSNSQPPSHESNMLTNEPPGQGRAGQGRAKLS